jgi:asparagine synthase (glutamine-hydrolysing)
LSGIVGVYDLGGCAVQPQALEEMLKALVHRGPDGQELWQEDSIGLGHCMLWTTPESLHEVLPFHDYAAELVITADARIDNRAELLDILKFDTVNTLEIADSEIILAAYQRWGEDCPEHLLGDFTFAIWDIKTQSLFCARDHFGIKPFYYYSSDQCFIFASEIKALLTSPNVPRLLNELKIADYLLPSMMSDKSMTIYQNIVRLPPGHWINISAHQDIQLHCYWSLKCPSSYLSLPCDQDYVDAFRDIFFEAVRCRLRSAFPIGSHLSGGLDSSTVTCVAGTILQEQLAPQLHTFSSTFENFPNCDEREYFNHVLEQGHYISHLVPADRSGPLTEWKTFFQYFDEPFLGPNHFLVHALNHAVQEEEVRVCLDGFDGDTTVSHGAFYFKELARSGDWSTFMAEAKAVSQHFDTSPAAILITYVMPYLTDLARNHQWFTFAQKVQEISQNFIISRRKIWIQYGLKPCAPQILIRFSKRLRNKTVCIDKAVDILSNEFSEQLNIKEFIKSREFNQLQPYTVAEDQQKDLTSGSFTHILELMDQGSSAVSIESRHPFMDKRLIEFCLALPPNQKLNQGWSRVIMRRAMGGVLPEQIRWRGGKASLEDSFEKGLLTKDRALIEEALFKPGTSAKFLNLSFLQQSFQDLTAVKREQQGSVMDVWRGGVLSLWLRERWLGNKPD